MRLRFGLFNLPFIFKMCNFENVKGFLPKLSGAVQHKVKGMLFFYLHSGHTLRSERQKIE